MIKEFFHKLFSRREEIEETDSFDFENLGPTKEDVNFRIEEERSRYITDYLERLKDVQDELELLQGEYDQVTSYLSDLETLVDLPKQEKDQLKGIIDVLIEVEKQYKTLLDRNDRMEDEAYYRIRSQIKELKEAIEKIREAEHQGSLIKQDLKRLDREKQKFRIRTAELKTLLANYKGMTVIFMIAFLVCMVILAAMQFAMNMNVVIGYFVAIVAFAFAMTILAVKYMDGDKEYERIQNTRKRLVRLTNTVKIRYVNNTNLLSYYYLKYHTESGKKLEQDYQRYQKEAEFRKQFSETENKREDYYNRLLNKLNCYQIRYPRRLAGSPECILDHKEQVEQRHSLILRRQTLRKQVEYNRKMKESIEGEIRFVIENYPRYAEEIYDMVNKFGLKKF